MSKAFELLNVEFSYRARDQMTGPAALQMPLVLKGISLSVQKGEFVAITGSSGSGKSTLLYLLGLMASPTAGEINILNQSTAQLSDEQRATLRSDFLGFVFQQFHLLNNRNVLENIVLASRYHKSNANDGMTAPAQNTQKATTLAKQLNIEDLLSKFPNQLSGGQQQRVAICRALFNDPEIILADEPTGNLDSENSAQTIQILRQLNRNFGKTVIIITHDPEVAKNCDRIIRIKDGLVQDHGLTNISSSSSQIATGPTAQPFPQATGPTRIKNNSFDGFIEQLKGSITQAKSEITRNKIRSALTMFGVSIGVAAVLAMITLGRFTKEKIVAGYSNLGVDSITFNGTPNWERQAVNKDPVVYRAFSVENDFPQMYKMLPALKMISPNVYDWDAAISYSGHRLTDGVMINGIGTTYFEFKNVKMKLGRVFSPIEISEKSSVCILGHQLGKDLFGENPPLGQIVLVETGHTSFACKVVGIVEKMDRQEQIDPNLQIHIPYTFFQARSDHPYARDIHRLLLQFTPGTDVEAASKQIEGYFSNKYGRSGTFFIDSNSKLVANLNQFMGLSAILLASIALITLLVGGVGITNMMLVAVAERIREIGLLRALGAKAQDIRKMFLTEAVFICFIAGIFGLFLGFFAYSVAIYFAAKMVKEITFEWTFDLLGFFISFSSILTVGILAGYFPALRAEKLEIIDALRSE